MDMMNDLKEVTNLMYNEVAEDEKTGINYKRRFQLYRILHTVNKITGILLKNELFFLSLKEKNGFVIGGLLLHIEKNKNRAYITNVVIRENLRGKGYGQQLIKRTIEFCKNRGVEIIEVRTWLEDEAAYHIYKKYGFKDVAKIFIVGPIPSLENLKEVFEVTQEKMDFLRKILFFENHYKFSVDSYEASCRKGKDGFYVYIYIPEDRIHDQIKILQKLRRIIFGNRATKLIEGVVMRYQFC